METVVAVHEEFPDLAPEIAEFLSNYETSSELVQAPLTYIEENDASAEEAALWWLGEYEDVWSQWVADDIAEKVKESL